jgi:hypothetical protein
METMGTKSIFGAFCWAMLLSSSTWAATLQPGSGQLSVNQGQGFQPVSSRVDANAGDSVMVGPGGSATLVYDDGCKVNVQPGAVATVAPISPCASGSYADDSNSNSDWIWVAGIGFVALGAIGAGIYAATNNANTNGTAASP